MAEPTKDDLFEKLLDVVAWDYGESDKFPFPHKDTVNDYVEWLVGASKEYLRSIPDANSSTETRSQVLG